MNLFVIDHAREYDGTGYWADTKVAVVDKYISLIWTERYYTQGDFEICVEATPENFDIFRPFRYIVREDEHEGSGVYSCAMCIMRVQLQTDEESGDYLIISGYDVKNRLHRRVTSWQNKSGQVLQVLDSMMSLVAKNQPTGYIDFITSATIPTSPSVRVQYTYDNLGEITEECLKKYGFGYRVKMGVSNGDNEAFELSFYEGTDRSLGQSVNSPVIFSEAFDNLVSSAYDLDYMNYKNTAYVLGSGDGQERRMQIAADLSTFNLDMFELYVDARDMTVDEEDPYGPVHYDENLQNRGYEKLAEHPIVETFEGQIIDNVTFIYGEDYFLGDIVQVENSYGISLPARIVEVITSDSGDGQKIITTFQYQGEEA